MVGIGGPFCSRADLLLNGAAAVVEHANARTNSTRNLPRDRPEVLAQRREMRVADDAGAAVYNLRFSAEDCD